MKDQLKEIAKKLRSTQNGMFATHKDMQDAWKYMETIAESCGGNKAGVITSHMVLYNSLLEHVCGLLEWQADHLPIKAINPKYQKTIDRFVEWELRYTELVDSNHSAEQPSSAMETKQEKAYEKAHELFHSLPKREQDNISKLMDTSGIA